MPLWWGKVGKRINEQNFKSLDQDVALNEAIACWEKFFIEKLKGTFDDLMHFWSALLKSLCLIVIINIFIVKTSQVSKSLSFF